MLRTRWEETLNRFRDRPAIFHGTRTLRFADLADALDAAPRATGTVVARGSAFDLALATLRGWRDDRPVLPLEAPDTSTPVPDLPGFAHLKRVPDPDGGARFACFRAAQLAADADRLVDAMGLSPDSPNLAAVSLAHSYGYVSILLPLLLHGVPLHVVDVPFPAVLADAMKGRENLTLPAVPSMWRAWHRSGVLKGAPIRLALSAGAPLTLELEHAVWETDGLKLHNFYGASECGGISWDPSDKPRELDGSLGTPLPGVDVALTGDGCFEIRSSSVAERYHPADGTLDGRVFRTPDHGHLEKGRLVLDSRGGEQINVAGRKVGPVRVEAALRATGHVELVRVFGVPSSDPERVDEIAALLPPGTDLAALRETSARTLPGWEHPRHWFLADDDSLWTRSRHDLRKHFSR